MENRIKTAVQFLKDGRSFSVEGLTMGINEEKDFYVTGWSQYIHLENISKAIAIMELSNIKEQFFQMVKISSELKDFIKKRNIKYNLAFNYGMGSIGLCSEKNGVLTWELNLE